MRSIEASSGNRGSSRSRVKRRNLPRPFLVPPITLHEKKAPTQTRAVPHMMDVKLIIDNQILYEDSVNF
jgi:hypothetical protein